MQLLIEWHRYEQPPSPFPLPPIRGEGCEGLATRSEPYPKLGEGGHPIASRSGSERGARIAGDDTDRLLAEPLLVSFDHRRQPLR